MLNRLLLLICAVAALATAPMAWAQTGDGLTLADVATAMEAGDTAVLSAATTDAAVIAPIANDPELLIEYWLSLAEACKAAGLNDEAITAYQKALEVLVVQRPARDLSLAGPMLEIGRLADDPAIKTAKSALELAGTQVDESELQALRASAAEHPADMDKQIAFAEAAFAANSRDEAADTLLAMIEHDREWSEGAARAKLLQIFEAVGLEDPWVVATRRRLSKILFG